MIVFILKIIAHCPLLLVIYEFTQITSDFNLRGEKWPVGTRAAKDEYRKEIKQPGELAPGKWIP
jgi:hypothetical protein